jgi:hypothetical protein
LQVSVTTRHAGSRRIPRGIALGGVVWLAAALAVGKSGALAAVSPPFPQVVLLGLSAALLALVAGMRGLRRFARHVDLRVLVAVHLTRFVGLYLLRLNARGELPSTFAVPAGWGDVLVAALALLPTFVVPLIIATHVVMLVRLSRTRPAPPGLPTADG